MLAEYLPAKREPGRLARLSSFELSFCGGVGGDGAAGAGGGLLLAVAPLARSGGVVAPDGIGNGLDALDCTVGSYAASDHDAQCLTQVC